MILHEPLHIAIATALVPILRRYTHFQVQRQFAMIVLQNRDGLYCLVCRDYGITIFNPSQDSADHIFNYEDPDMINKIINHFNTI